MKGSHVLLKLSLLSSLLLVAPGVFAEDNVTNRLDTYLSGLKQQELSYDYQKNEAESSKLRDSWIMPITLKYSYKKSEPYGVEQTSENAAIVLDQPIFQSGGIYYGIKFAEASRKYADYSIDQQRRMLIKEAISLLMQVKQSGLRIERQNLQIANSNISLEQRQEEYLNGQLDSGFLNNAIIETNLVTQTLYDIETNKERLVSKFQSLSDLDYTQAKIPYLRLVAEAEFLENNIDLKLVESETEKNRYNKNVTVAKYLPKVSLTASYNWDKYDRRSIGATQTSGGAETDYSSYGFKASMPLDINTFRDVESAQVTYLKSKVVIDDRKRELKALFEQVMQNLENYDKKIKLARENEALYAKLLSETKVLFEAGYKTSYEVENLENSVKIQEIDRRIFEMDKQLELLNLYEKLTDDV
ncbi:MAG: TolC family protein [Campylobacterota bacterium]|nr:TolC family protein [Campylobacterota bacterium]